MNTLMKVAQHAEQLRRETIARDAAIVAAWAEGHPLRAIGEAAQRSAANIQQVIARRATCVAPDEVTDVLDAADLLRYLLRGRVIDRDGRAMILLTVHDPDTDGIYEPLPDGSAGPEAAAVVEQITATLAQAGMEVIGPVFGQPSAVIRSTHGTTNG